MGNVVPCRTRGLDRRAFGRGAGRDRPAAANPRGIDQRPRAGQWRGGPQDAGDTCPARDRHGRHGAPRQGRPPSRAGDARRPPGRAAGPTSSSCAPAHRGVGPRISPNPGLTATPNQSRNTYARLRLPGRPRPYRPNCPSRVLGCAGGAIRSHGQRQEDRWLSVTSRQDGFEAHRAQPGVPSNAGRGVTPAGVAAHARGASRAAGSDADCVVSKGV
jgi:hypothetical protein